MTLPKAIIDVQLRTLDNLPPLSSADRPYVLAKIGGRMFGRSRPIPRSATSFDLAAEPMPWRHQAPDDGSGVTLEVEIWDDRDEGPQRIASLSETLRPTSPARARFGRTMAVECDVLAEVFPGPIAPTIAVQRVPSGGTARSHVVPTNVVAVEFQKIEGLYKPGVQSEEQPYPLRSGYEPGYHSEDHLGRIFINRDLSGAWTKQRQQIALTVNVRALRGRIPPDAKVRWTIEVPDNPINDLTEVHRASGPILDAGDYDGVGNPTGADGNDNEGTVHVPQSADSTAPWEEVSSFSIGDSNDTSATTAIVDEQSSVILHCPNTNGDRLIVSAVVEDPSVHALPTRTGTMTMWRRIDVEYLRMPSAVSLPVDGIWKFFEPACVQLDFAPERVLAQALDRPYMTARAADRHRNCHLFLRQASEHLCEEGWFHLVSANRDLRDPPPPRRHDVTRGVISQRPDTDCVTVEGVFPDALGVKLRFGSPQREVVFRVLETTLLRIDPTTRGQTIVTQPDQATHTLCPIDPQTITPKFTHGDGNMEACYREKVYYYPQREGNDSSWFLGRTGFGAPDNVDVEVVSGAPPGASGVSPPIDRNGTEYFAGRTFLFDARDHTPNYVINTIVHEFIHAFGMPHICGQHDYRTPRKHACAMSYENHGLVNETLEIIADNAENTGPWPCALHLREVRRTKLEDNAGLQWGGGTTP